VIDEWSRESLAIEVDVSLTGERVTRVLERVSSGRGAPALKEILGTFPPGIITSDRAKVYDTHPLLLPRASSYLPVC